HETAFVAVLRYVRESQVSALAHGCASNVATSEQDASPRDGPQTRDRLDELRLSVSLDARDAEDLAGRDGKRDAVDDVRDARAGDCEILHFKSGSRPRRLGLRAMSDVPCPMCVCLACK